MSKKESAPSGCVCCDEAGALSRPRDIPVKLVTASR